MALNDAGAVLWPIEIEFIFRTRSNEVPRLLISRHPPSMALVGSL